MSWYGFMLANMTYHMGPFLLCLFSIENPSLVVLGICNQQDWQSPIIETTSFQPTLGFQDLALLNPERDLSNACKYGFVFEVLGNDTTLVMKTKGLFWFLDG